MKKTAIIILLSILSLALITLSKSQIDNLNQNKIKLNISSFTKATCKDNYCQDYIFECENKKIRSITPITGAAIQFGKDWKDPRTKEQINKVC